MTNPPKLPAADMPTSHTMGRLVFLRRAVAVGTALVGAEPWG